MSWEPVYQALGIWVVTSPFLLVVVFGLSSLLFRPLSERAMALLTRISVISGLTAAVAILAIMLFTGTRNVPVEIGNWVAIPEQHFHFHLKFIFDRLSVPFVILSFVLCGTVGAFADVYLHRDSGYSRFFLFYALFLLGMVTSSVAGTIETMFSGWELVGLSSALLVAFFQDRANPVRNGLRVWSVYRISDAAFLIAAVALHHLTGEGDFTGVVGAGAWPTGVSALTSQQAAFVGALLLVAAAGKSGLVPFSGWLPRAMEGPTPSSAVFYGALSVHLGAFMLLRVSPIIDLSPGLSVAVIVLGLVTAVYGTLAGRVQSDIKSALAFASVTQLGIIVAEIGFGFRYLALVHMIGHACLRTLQMLRAPTLLRDYHALENAIGDHLPQAESFWERWLPAGLRLRMYRFSLERGYLDTFLADYLVRPAGAVLKACDRLERKWTDFLSGGQSRESDRIPSSPETLEELQ